VHASLILLLSIPWLTVLRFRFMLACFPPAGLCAHMCTPMRRLAAGTPACLSTSLCPAQMTKRQAQLPHCHLYVACEAYVNELNVAAAKMVDEESVHVCALRWPNRRGGTGAQLAGTQHRDCARGAVCVPFNSCASGKRTRCPRSEWCKGCLWRCCSVSCGGNLQADAVLLLYVAAVLLRCRAPRARGESSATTRITSTSTGATPNGGCCSCCTQRVDCWLSADVLHAQIRLCRAWRA
jgi:hypothetical protein